MTTHLDLFEQLVRAETRLWNQLDRQLASEGTPLGWFAALRVVAATSGCRVSDLAQVLDISQGGASKLVDRLVAAGLLARTVDPADRRASRLALTREGDADVERCEGIAEEWLGETFRGVRTARRGELSELFAGLAQRRGQGQR
jgi:MarR family transcriptional regulator, multiple antibiotic resistance protein MarR